MWLDEEGAASVLDSVITTSAVLGPLSFMRLMSCSGTISTPRFLMVSVPTRRTCSAALSGFSRKGSSSTIRNPRASGVATCASVLT